MDFDKQVEIMCEKNKLYIDLFNNYLKDEGLADRTINRHIQNITMYINDYLNFNEVKEMKDGCYLLTHFFTDWYPTLVQQPSSDVINTYCSTVKKFYKLMLENKYISQEDYDSLVYDIKNYKDEWLALCDH